MNIYYPFGLILAGVISNWPSEYAIYMISFKTVFAKVNIPKT